MQSSPLIIGFHSTISCGPNINASSCDSKIQIVSTTFSRASFRVHRSLVVRRTGPLTNSTNIQASSLHWRCSMNSSQRHARTANAAASINFQCFVDFEWRYSISNCVFCVSTITTFVLSSTRLRQVKRIDRIPEKLPTHPSRHHTNYRPCISSIATESSTL